MLHEESHHRVFNGPRTSIYDLRVAGTNAVRFPEPEVEALDIEALFGEYARKTELILPEISENDLMRHYTHLADMNFGVDTGMYPLGSCTMKYNPRINEAAARITSFASAHPYQPEWSLQGSLELLHELQQDLAEISGFAATSLQPSAGAHGEYAALLVFRAAHIARGNARKKVILPDTSHGTNPASVAMCGYEVVTIPSNAKGMVDLEALKRNLDEDVAAFMLTNPNTVGIFEENILEITKAVHEVGAYAYCDGANLNAILGVNRPADIGFDALHINVHKTFSTPHGGGGPGAGPICVTEELAPFLPGPLVVKNEEGSYSLQDPEQSIGRVRTFAGNFGVLVRAYTYIKSLGAKGLRDVAVQAVLSANYLRVKLEDSYEVAYDGICMHEFVLSAAKLKREKGVRTLDIAKRLLDYGFHPPTIYFPLIVEEAMMIEPTETESKESLDRFVSVMRQIATEANENPELLLEAPFTTPVRRLDEASAARKPDLRWMPSHEVQ